MVWSRSRQYSKYNNKWRTINKWADYTLKLHGHNSLGEVKKTGVISGNLGLSSLSSFLCTAGLAFTVA